MNSNPPQQNSIEAGVMFPHHSGKPLHLTIQIVADSMSPPSTTYTASGYSISESLYVRRMGGTFYLSCLNVGAGGPEGAHVCQRAESGTSLNSAAEWRYMSVQVGFFCRT